MSTLVTRTRKASPQFVANAKQPVDLTRGNNYRELILRLTSQPTLTAGNNIVAKTLPGDDWGVIKKLELIVNGSNVIFSLPGQALFWLNKFVYQRNPYFVPTLGDGATANPSLDSTLIIPFWMPRMANPFDTVLYSGEMSAFRLDTTFGTFTDINASATAFTTNPLLEIGSQESELPILSNGPLLPPLLNRVIQYTQVVSGATPAFRFPLDTGNPLYRGLLIQVTTTASPAVDTGALFSNVKLVSGSQVFFDMSEPMLAQYSRLPSTVPFSEYKSVTSGIGYQGSPRVSASSAEAGWYYIDLCADGYSTEAINTVGLSELYLEFNVVSGCTINVYAQQLINLNRPPLK